MFTKRTVFVLGAGASVRYGFPTSGELLSKIQGAGPATLSKRVGGRLHPDQLEPLKEALQGTLAGSIDSMLERRADLQDAGKLLMAGLLLDDELGFTRPIRGSDEDWLSWVFQQMSRGAQTLDRFCQNQVCFITFNYDRLLEYTFVKALSVHYNCTAQECWTAFSKIPLIHLHGSLGPLFPDPAAAAKPVPFGAKYDTSVNRLAVALTNVTTSIRIVHDAVPTSPEFVSARMLLEQADQIIFLGFGFGEDNARRLDLGRIPGTTEIYCSVFGMTGAEIGDSVQSHFTIGRTARFECDNSELCMVLRNRVWIAR